jgi:putative addiction module component (TIGR02574 family)
MVKAYRMNALPEGLREEGYDPQLTPSQQAELDRRLKAHAKNPDDVVPWEVVKASLNAKYGKP